MTSWKKAVSPTRPWSTGRILPKERQGIPGILSKKQGSEKGTLAKVSHLTGLDQDFPNIYMHQNHLAVLIQYAEFIRIFSLFIQNNPLKATIVRILFLTIYPKLLSSFSI